ncbi:MAG: DUF1549 domain-containing protein [Planctomycetales bacterium]|nr:DUF1549 domain-containing protein [Planctomycetales bacterium]
MFPYADDADKGEGAAVPQKEIEVIRNWIKLGASHPADEEVLDPREHWPYRPPQQQSVPIVRDPSSIRNPIDSFVAVKRHEYGLQASPPMDKSRLLRRVYLDLTGVLRHSIT